MLPSLPSCIISSRAPMASKLLQLSVRRRGITSSCAIQYPANATASSSRCSLPSCSNINRLSSSPRAQAMPSLRSISHTASIQAHITVNVPTMGDSITEGTIVEWCVSPGSHVSEGDVLALVETDKVTVDIKAEQEGVLVKQLGEVDGVVEVGKGLYILDTDVSTAASVAAAAPAVETVVNVSEVNASLDADKISAAPASASVSTRVPSIHFLGKDGWKARLAATDEPAAAAATTAPSPTTIVPTSNKPHAPSSITQIPYSSMYGRPPITDEEMEALILGGADEAPEVHSVVSKEGLSGVVFVGGKITTAGPRGVWLAE